MSVDMFKSSSKSLRRLFGDSDSFYQIPNYQRPYSWEDEQVLQLLGDLKDAFDNRSTASGETNPYFLGSIILIDKKDYFDVVDGQQRLTTLTILFSVLRDLRTDLPAKTQNILKASILDTIDEKQRLRFTTAIDRQNEFEQTIVRGVQFPSEAMKGKRKQRISNYLNTASIFKAELASMDVDQIDAFVNYIFECVQVIVITCQSESFAIKLFQVLNDRGLDLSDADLFKSYLMNLLPPNRHDQFLADWKWIEGQMNTDDESEESVTDLLNHYLYFTKAANPKRGIYEDLVEEIKGRDANEVVFDLKNFCRSYKAISDSESPYVYALFSLNQEIYWTSILMGAYHKKRTDIEELAHLLRNFYYLNWIAGYSAPKIKQPSFNVLALIKENAPLAQIESLLADSLKANLVLKRVESALLGDVYKEKWLKPLMLLLEYGLVEEATSYLGNRPDIHVEHVLPKAFTKDAYWTSQFSRNQAASYLNCIANLTLLSGKQNIAASYEAFPQKISIYNGKGRDQKSTAFQTSQWIANRFAAGEGDWNPKALKARFEWIIGNVEREFGIKLQHAKFEQIGQEFAAEIVEEIVDERESSDHQVEPKFSPVAFKDECIVYVSNTTGLKFTKSGRSASKLKIDGSTRSALCLVSREYNRSKQGYWFAFHPDQRDLMEENPQNLLLLGCGAYNQVLAIPSADFIPLVDRMNITELKDADRFYWHIHVEKSGAHTFIILKGGEKVDISKFAIGGEKTKAS